MEQSTTDGGFPVGTGGTNAAQQPQELPKYKCYKEVWALKIVNILPPRTTSENTLLTFKEEGAVGYPAVEVTKEWMDKHNPQIGGYYVVYKDGYKSYSPAKAFEEGYELIK